MRQRMNDLEELEVERGYFGGNFLPGRERMARQSVMSSYI